VKIEVKEMRRQPHLRFGYWAAQTDDLRWPHLGVSNTSSQWAIDDRDFCYLVVAAGPNGRNGRSVVSQEGGLCCTASALISIRLSWIIQ